MLFLIKDTSIFISGQVGQIPDRNTQSSVTDRLSASMCFVSEELVVLCDGAGKVHVCCTGDRNSSQQWKVSMNTCTIISIQCGQNYSLHDNLSHTVHLK